MLYVCSCKLETDSNIFSDSFNSNKVYVQGIKLGTLGQVDFTFIKKELDKSSGSILKLPKRISRTLFNVDFTNEEVFLNWYSKRNDFIFGDFTIKKDKLFFNVIVSFTKNGNPIDYLCFKNKEKKEDYILSYTTLYYPSEGKDIVVNIMGKDEKNSPLLGGKVIRKDIWFIDNKGIFQKRGIS